MKSTQLIMALLVLVTVAVSAFWKCTASSDSSREYTPQQFKIIAQGLVGDEFELIIHVPEEAGFYCPGADYRTRDGLVHFTVARERIGTEKQVGVRAKKQEDGSLKLAFPMDKEAFESGESYGLVDSSGKHLGLWWRAISQ